MKIRHVIGLAATATALGAAGVVWAASRSRPLLAGVEGFDPPPGLPPARIVAVPGHGEMFVREDHRAGPRAPTLVLVHGWVVPADVHWFTCYADLARDTNLVAVDLRGHGRGSRPPMPFRLPDAADDIAALLRHLGIGPAVVLGYSMGGAVTQLVWQRHPDVVAGMVLAATAARFDRSLAMRLNWRLMGALQVSLRLLPRTVYERVLLAVVRGEIPDYVPGIPDNTTALADHVGWLVGELQRGHPEDIAEAGRELGRFDSRGWLPTVDVPAAVILTTRDQMVPPPAQLELAQHLPDVEVFPVDADHDAPATSPQAFTEAVLKAVHHVSSVEA